jgi:ribosome-associated translation inhibitor RaiA
MRPIVNDACGQFDAQTRAYAEYRVFAGLMAEQVCTAAVTVALARTTTDGGSGPGDAVCAITVTMCHDGVLEATAIEHHPYAAIDRATELILRAVRKPAALPVRVEPSASQESERERA